MGSVANGILKKNQNAPRPSEHPPVMGKKMSKRLDLFCLTAYDDVPTHLFYFDTAIPSDSARIVMMRSFKLSKKLICPTG